MDGSGGRKGSNRRRRRCGWSVVQIDELGRAVGVLSSSLGVKLQTVPRSELQAVLKALKSIPGDLAAWPDCKYVVGDFRNLRAPLPKPHRTVWIEARRKSGRT